MNDVVNIVYIVLIVLSILCSAFFSGSEIAFASATEPTIRRWEDEGKKREKRAAWICRRLWG